MVTLFLGLCRIHIRCSTSWRAIFFWYHVAVCFVDFWYFFLEILEKMSNLPFSVSNLLIFAKTNREKSSDFHTIRICHVFEFAGNYCISFKLVSKVVTSLTSTVLLKPKGRKPFIYIILTLNKYLWIFHSK